jgi:hypothetical protein
MLELVINARKASIGPGMTVNRILPFRKKRMVGPFIFMDHAGPVQAAPGQSMDVLPHPHIGLSTVTYLLGGEVMHRDSLGTEQPIQTGEVNWMTAGSGITHSERFEDPQVLASGKLEMLQTWVALPEQFEETSPSFEHYQPEKLPIFQDQGLQMRLIAGQAFGLNNEVKTLSPLFYIHLEMESGAVCELPKNHAERAVLVVKGKIECHHEVYGPGQLLVFNHRGSDPDFKALEKSTLMMLGGEPLGERFIWWNFVHSRKERIEEAKHEWKSGNMKLPPTDDQEFVPLPESRSKPAGSSPEPDALS